MAGPVSMVTPRMGKRWASISSAIEASCAAYAVPRSAWAASAGFGSDSGFGTDSCKTGLKQNIARLPSSWRRRKRSSAGLRTAEDGDAREDQAAVGRVHAEHEGRHGI